MIHGHCTCLSGSADHWREVRCKYCLEEELEVWREMLRKLENFPWAGEDPPADWLNSSQSGS